MCERYDFGVFYRSFAPVTGKEARHTIVQQFDELKEKLKELEKKLYKSGINDSIKSEDEEEVGV